MRILIVHQYYLFPGQPGGSRFNEFARLWAEAGHEVTVIAGTLNYATGDSPTRYRRRLITRESDGPVTVLRAHVPRSYARGYAGRMWAFFGFTLSASLAVLRAARPDVIVATSPPLVTVIPGWIASRLRWRRVPWVFEMRDLWPESAVSTGVLKAGSLLTRILYRLEAWGARRADTINVLTPAFRDDIVRRRLASDSKIVFVPNGADVRLFEPGPRDNEVRARHGWRDRFVVLYAGAHGRANALDQLLRAADRLQERTDILIASVGDGPERKRLEDEACRLKLSNIQFLGPQPKESMGDYVRAADVGTAVLQRNETFKTVYPNKVFDYMACERPVLLAIDGVARRLVCDEARAGVFAEPEDAESLAGAILDLAGRPEARAEMGRRGRAWVLANATRESLAAKYLGILESLGVGGR